MHDIRRLREDGAAFDAALAKRGLAPVAETILARDADWRRVTTELQLAQQRRNEASKLIGTAKRNGEPADALMAEVAELKDRMAQLEADERRLGGEVEELLAGTYRPTTRRWAPTRTPMSSCAGSGARGSGISGLRTTSRSVRAWVLWISRPRPG